MEDQFFNQFGRHMKEVLGRAVSVAHVQSHEENPENFSQASQVLYGEVQSAYRLTEKFMQYQQLVFSDLDAETIEAAPVVRAHTKVVERLWEYKNLEILSYIEAVNIKTAPEFFDFVVVELLDNACRYAPVSSEVKISLVRDGQEVAFEVSNSVDKPLSQDAMEKLGNVFFKGESVVENGGASGAGLSLACIKKASPRFKSTMACTQTEKVFGVRVVLPHGLPD